MEMTGITGKLKELKPMSFLLLLLATCLPLSAFAKDPILVIRADGREFREVLGGIISEVTDDFTVYDMIVTKTSTSHNIAVKIQNLKPKIAVLMDNKSISLFKKYQNEIKDTSNLIPSISLMGVLIEEAVSDLRNAAGISYEIPAVTSILSIRSVLKEKIETAGVVHRNFLNKFVESNKAVCRKEGIELFDVALPNKSGNMKFLLKKALEELVESKGVQALWVPNDNILLQPDFIQSVWVPYCANNRVPVIVGVDVFVDSKLDFGTFAVLPDHVSLGIQAAEMIYSIRDNGWQVRERKVEPPLAVYKIINYKQAKKQFGIIEDALGAIDKVLK